MAGIPLHTVLEHLRRLHGVADAAPRSDRELLRSFVTDNDQDAFAVVVARHAPLVWGVCRRILGHQQDAEDAFQATFLILARRAGSARWQASVGGWLYTVAHRLAVRAHQRGEQRRLREQEASRRPRAESSLCELAAVVDEELQQLPAKYREPLLLHYLEGAKAEAAARQLGLRRGTFYHRLNRGRELLRARLSRQGLSLAAPLLASALTQEAEAAAPSLIQAALGGVRGNIPERVAILAAEAVRNTLLTKLRVGLALGLLLGAAAGGVAMLAPRAPMAPITRAEPPADPPKADGKPAVRVDRYGDPLPEGAVARLGSLRFRVDAEIVGLAFAPDGKTIAVRGNGGLWLLDAVSGKRLRRVDPSGTLNPCIAFSPDGKRLMGTCDLVENGRFRYVVRVWETSGGREVMESEENAVRWLGWSADGQPLAAYLGKGEMRLRDLATGRERRFLAKDLPDSIRSKGCFCTVGKNALAANGEKGLVHVWDLASGEARCILQTGGDFLRSLCLSPDGRWLASLAQDAAGKYAVQLWDATIGKATHNVAADQKNLDVVAFAPDGKTLATVGWTEIRFWDVATGRELRRISSASGAFGRSIAFAPDGKTLATAERHGVAIHLWDVARGVMKPEPEGHGNRPGPVFSPDGKRLATSGSLDGTIRVWNPATGEPLVCIHRGEWVRDCAFSADGRTLYSCWTNDKLYFDGAASGRELYVAKVEDTGRPKMRQSGLDLHLSDDFTRLIVFSTGDNRETLVTGWDAVTRKQLFQRNRPHMDLGHALSADGRVLAAPHPTSAVKGAAMGPMRLEDAATGELLLTFPALEGQTWPLAFSPDGRLLASNNFDWKRKDKKGDPAAATGNALHLWETATAAEVLTLALDNQCQAAFSPDGSLLALTAPPQQILVWDFMLGRERQRFQGFNTQVTSLAFSPDGRRLVSGLSDSTLLVWDVRAREKAPLGKLGAEGVAKAWADLAGADAPRAFRARWTLASAPAEAIALLTEHLHPAKAADPQRLRRLLADLESERFAEREKAQADLEDLGDLAEPALRQTLPNKPTLEVRRRVQAVLERLRGPVTRPDLLRSLRAVAVLEDIGTPPARRLLEGLAKGAPEARLTREAKASLHRLDLRSAPSQ